MPTLQSSSDDALVVCPIAKAGAIDLSIVLPTFNESQNITTVLERLTTHLDSVPDLTYEIIVVDDDSPDLTWEKALQISERLSQVRVLRRQAERGLSTAVIRGWQIARGNILGVMDADLQHPPEVVVKLWKEMARGADLAVASRHIEGGGVSDWSLSRRIVSRCAQIIGFSILPEVTARVSDPMSGFFMVTRSSLAGHEMNPLGYKILIEVMGRAQPRWISEVPYTFCERAEGFSKVNTKIYVEYFWHLLRLRIDLLKNSSLFRFCLVGLGGVVIDMSFLFLLSDPRMLGWGLTRSKVLAAEAAIINNFIWNDLWTFGAISKRQNSVSQRIKRLVKFNAICSIGLIFNVIILNIEFNFLHMNRYFANLIAIMIVTFWNFFTNVKLNWRVTEEH